jgi:hypothetical protein
MKNEKVAVAVKNAVENIKAVCNGNDEADYGIIVIAAIPDDGEEVNRYTTIAGNKSALVSATTLAMLDYEVLENIITMALKTLPLAKSLKPFFDKFDE